tara:strand:+ start:732 stop:899 length:168 start_codon:yes stop_codon:yes gene_type:complete
MFWELMIGILLFFLYGFMYSMSKKIDTLQKDNNDLMSIVRVLRYHAMKNREKEDK